MNKVIEKIKLVRIGKNPYSTTDINYLVESKLNEVVDSVNILSHPESESKYDFICQNCLGELKQTKSYEFVCTKCGKISVLSPNSEERVEFTKRQVEIYKAVINGDKVLIAMGGGLTTVLKKIISDYDLLGKIINDYIGDEKAVKIIQDILKDKLVEVENEDKLSKEKK